MNQYLTATEIIDWKHPEIMDRAKALSQGESDKIHTAKRCFEWVRDNILHSFDYQRDPVTCIASDVLMHQSGYCYAKSHLLAALLRANTIPAGICYQRLSRDDNGPPFCLHALNAVYLDGYGWYRIDARGNNDQVDAQFDPPRERLAFYPKINGEIDLPMVFSDPLPNIIEALKTFAGWQQMHENLPDLDLLQI